jgi:hypothetical protein
LSSAIYIDRHAAEDRHLVRLHGLERGVGIEPRLQHEGGTGHDPGVHLDGLPKAVKSGSTTRWTSSAL